MTFREAFYNVKRLLEDRLHDFGLEGANASTMGWKTMLSIVQNTRITINVPSNLTYTDEFLITGILEISTHSRLNGKTVKLKVGDTIVATTTTNVNGEYSFTHSPVSAGTHSFQVIFEGTDIYTSSESSIVTRTANKETSVMNLDAEHTRHYGESVFLNGFLLTNDGEPIRNASVKCYINGSLFRTLSTFNSGEFNLSITINSFDSLNVQFVYEGDSNYTSVSASQTIEIYQPVLRLTSDKDILSYADNESAIITAQLVDDAPIPQELKISDSVKIYKDGILVATEQTDSQGRVTYEYESQGVGDVDFTFECRALNKTYSIEDCWIYYPSNITSSLTVNWNLPTDCIIEFETYISFVGRGQAWYPILGTDVNHRIVLGSIQDATTYQMWVHDNSSTAVKTNSAMSLPTGWNSETITIKNGTVTFHDLSVTPSNVDLTNLWMWGMYSTSAQFRNIKIKPL